MNKLSPTYSSPFDPFGASFSPISRKEAAQLLGQWRRNGSIRRVGSLGRPHGYAMVGQSGEKAAMALKNDR